MSPCVLVPKSTTLGHVHQSCQLLWRPLRCQDWCPAACRNPAPDRASRHHGISPSVAVGFRLGQSPRFDRLTRILKGTACSNCHRSAIEIRLQSSARPSRWLRRGCRSWCRSRRPCKRRSCCLRTPHHRYWRFETAAFRHRWDTKIG